MPLTLIFKRLICISLLSKKETSKHFLFKICLSFQFSSVQNYENKFINVAPIDNSCNQSVTNLDLRQLAGLWVILGATLVISLILHLVTDIFVKGDKKLKLLLSSRRKKHYTKEERKIILETYPMVEDFIHIPSKDLHRQVEKDIKGTN